MTNRLKRNIVILMVIAMFALTSVVPTASALDCNTQACFATGYIKLSGIFTAATEANSNGHPDVVITNSTVAANTTLTNATGGYILPIQEGANAVTINATHEYGYTVTTGTITVTAGNASQNFTVEAELATISGVTESSITKDSGIISASLLNSTIGSYLQYSTDSSLTNNVYTLSWQNSSAAPSFTISNLQGGTKIYYRVTAYNQYDNNNTDSATIGDFTTLKSGTSSSYKPPAAATAAVQQNVVQQIISPKSSDAKKKQIFVGLVILAAGVLYYYGMPGNKGTGKGGKKK